MVSGSWAYCAQLGVGTADPIHSSCVSAVASPGAPSAAEYSAVGGRLRKSPTPPRRMPRGNAPPPPPPPPPASAGDPPPEPHLRATVPPPPVRPGANAHSQAEGAV